MSDIQKLKNPSPLIQSVLALDTFFSDMLRIGERIEKMDLRTEFDFENAERLMAHFAKCGEGVSHQVVQLSTILQDLRSKSEANAQVVSERAQLLSQRKLETQECMDQLRALGERIKGLTLSLADLQKGEGGVIQDNDRAIISMRLSEFDLQLQPLIEEVHALHEKGKILKIRIVEQSADALKQSLSAVHQKLSRFQQDPVAQH